MFHLMIVHYTFSSVWVAEWPPFGKKLPARLAICSHCVLSVCNINLFPVLALIAGFGLLMFQFLFIAFLLLLKICNQVISKSVEARSFKLCQLIEDDE